MTRMDSNTPFGVIWDVDGTLVDTAEQHFQAWQQLCRELDIQFSRADFNHTFGWRNPEIIHHLFGSRHSGQEIATMGERKEQFYRAQARLGVTLLPGVQALLQAVRDRGGRQAIGSSAPSANLQLILEVTGIRDYFTAIASAEDTQRGKPDPQVFQVAAQRLDIPAQRCVVIEDAVVGVQAARAGGMKCIAVCFAGHHPANKLRAAGADLVVRSLQEVDVATIQRLVDGNVAAGAEKSS